MAARDASDVMMRDDNGSPASDSGQPRPAQKTEPARKQAEVRGWASLAAGGKDAGGGLEASEDRADQVTMPDDGVAGKAREQASSIGAARSSRVSKRPLRALGDGNRFGQKILKSQYTLT
jgi:hypothetical protein